MTKAQKTKNLKLGVLGLLGAWSLGFGVSDAEERGIGVSPARIEIGRSAEWPYTAPIIVTNLSSEAESFEVLLEKDEGTVVSVSPGRFSLDAGANTRVLITFEESRGAAEGLVKVVSTRTWPEGFTTGTGIKIPFSIDSQRLAGQGDNTKFLAGVVEAFGRFGVFSQVFGAGMMLATLIFLWYLSGIARLWIFNSDKR